MLIFRNIDALPGFRKTVLLSNLRSIEPAIDDVSAEFIHLVDSPKLPASASKKLETILSYDQPFRESAPGELFFVIPRPGTISPWSTKATDIAKSCGLKAVERIERGTAYYISSKKQIRRASISEILHDRMTDRVIASIKEAEQIFHHDSPVNYHTIDILKEDKKSLAQANARLGLALSAGEIEYLYSTYQKIKRNPTDIELMMFAAVNSEHCRHKIFNAEWTIDGQKQAKSLFKMIRNTYDKNPENVLSAYSDNAAVLKGPATSQLFINQSDGRYRYRKEPTHLVIKAETHNHPTAIAPSPGAATGIGGEIRDEGATGRGGKSKMGFTGYSVSNLNLAELPQPWEHTYGKPARISSPLDIMVDAPLGGSGFANEFGRPNLAGYFRTYEQEHEQETWGYHKPLMIAGGLGSIRDKYVQKKKVRAGAKLIVLGGPSMLIGLGGGAASSLQSGQSDTTLDFASVQRANAEMQRRAQEVITACWMQDDNPIVSIHDVGAGGLSNAFPELVHDNGLGAKFALRAIPNAEPGMSPLEIWCNEAQERYVLAVEKNDLDRFNSICERERCPFAVVGTATKEARLVLYDEHFDNTPIDIPMDVLFGNPPKMTRVISKKQKASPLTGSGQESKKRLDLEKVKLDEAIKRVLNLPAVASKKFLITIGDRTVGGLSVRDQMVGPWQVPVSDVAVTASSFSGNEGEAMAIGERMPIAIMDAPASARMAVGEAITNIAAAPISRISDVKLSANWMAAAGHKSEDQNLYDAVYALGEEFCPELGVCIPVGKDSLSMRTTWQDDGKEKSVTSPMSVVISAYSPVTDTSRVLTPRLKEESSVLILIDLGEGENRLGGSALTQVYAQVGGPTPDINPHLLYKFFSVIQELNSASKLMAYHDRSDGGLLATLTEMAFAGRCGLDVNLSGLNGQPLEQLFNEELGAVLQVSEADKSFVLNKLKSALGDCVHLLGKPTKEQTIVIKSTGSVVYKNFRATLESWWASTSYHVQKLRDNPTLAKNEHDIISDDEDPGIAPKLTFAPQNKKRNTVLPKAAILREQGVNGQAEMAAAFERAGFQPVDVHLNDIYTGRQSLTNFSVLALCGGFSYGDVLGAGEGWAKSILFNKKLLAEFKSYFERKDTLSLGVCNGCQALAGLKTIIPGADFWPRFLHNDSGRFEARLTSVKVNDTPSIFFKGMDGSILPVPVAHGEGKAVFASDANYREAINKNLITLQYVDNYHEVTERYPYNPNGSSGGITSLTSKDGRSTILMPHPERAFLSKQLSYHPDDWTEESPWLQIFQNARDWLDNHS